MHHSNYLNPGSTRISRSAFAAGFSLFALAVSSFGQSFTEFFPASTITVGNDVTALAKADFDRDGRLDLAVLNRTAGTVSILGNRGGRFVTLTTLGAGIRPSGLIVGDFNHDGREDLLVLASPVLLYKQIPLGLFRSPFFESPVSISAGGNAVADGVTADFNRDGNIDLVTFSGGTGLVLVTGAADGFAPKGTRIISNANGGVVRALDIDQDSDLDLVYSSTTSPLDLGFVLNNGNGTFGPPQTRRLAQRLGALELIKFTRDDTEDIVLSPATPSQPVKVLRIAGGPQVEITTTAVVPEIFQTDVADANGDGIDDLFVLSSAGRNVTLLTNPNDLRFQQVRTIATLPVNGLGTKAIAAGDFNNDGLADVAVALDNPANPAGDDQVVLYLNPDKGGRTSNVATRTLLASGRNVATGFAVDDVPTRVLIRAVGPGLEQFGITSFNRNPRFTVQNNQGEVGRNDNWSADAANLAAVTEAARDAGAFTLTQGSNDAATVLTLNPGAYTIVTTGDGTGEVFVEVHVLEGVE